MKNLEIEKYNGEGSLKTSSDSSYSDHDYALLSGSQQLFCIGSFILVESALIILDKINPKRDKGILNFITPLNAVEEVKLSKAYKYGKIYKIAGISNICAGILDGTSFILRSALEDQIDGNIAVKGIMPQTSFVLSMYTPILNLLTNISGRVLLHMIPDEEIEAKEMNNIINKNNMLIKSKSDSNLKDKIKDRTKGSKGLERSQSDSNLLKNKATLQFKPKLQLNKETNEKLAKILADPNSEPLGTIYFNVKPKGDIAIQIEEEEVRKLQ